MRCRILIGFLLLVFALTAQRDSSKTKHQIKACYPTWISKEYPVSKLPFEQLDEIWLSFAYPGEDGSLDTSDIADIDLFEYYVKKNDLQAVLVVGGATKSENFHPVSADSSLRKKFCNELVEYAVLHGFSGVNIDWEYWPKPEQVDPVASNNYVLLMKELKSSCEKYNLELSICVFASNWYGKHYPAETANYINEVVIMAMDGAGSWSEVAHHSSLDLFRQSWFYWKAKFAPHAAVKYSFTVPFYGVAFQKDHKKGDPVRHPSYDELVSMTASAAKEDTLNVGNEVIIHASKTTMKEKVSFLKMQQLGDLVIWQIGFDSREEEFSLLNYMKSELKE